MKNPDISNPLDTYGTALETALMTTIHLINDSIFTNQEVAEETTEESGMGEFFMVESK
jgi:hypothetical protein